MKNEQTIEVVIDVTAEDYRRVLFWYHWKRIALIGLVWLILFPTILWLVAFGAGASPFTSNNNSPLIVFVIFALLPILLSVSLYFSIWKQAKKIEKISEKTHFIFSDSGIDSKNTLAASQFSWERLDKIYETKTDFIFFPQENVFYAIPKRFFQSDEQIKNFKTLISEELGKKAKLFK
jgi:YcxB-like protein